MKIAILGDTHLGFKADSSIFLEAYLKFFEEQFFPYLIKNNIKTVVHLGDVLDRRKFINFNTLYNIRTRFSEKFREYGITVHCVIGNHDCYWKNTNHVNSCIELFRDFFVVHETPQDIILDGMICGFVPWISNENQDEVLHYLSTSNADVIFGHFELSGYEVSRGVKHEDGMSPSLLARFDKVYSGHFHCKQEYGNIHYMGTPYDMFFSDVVETKGFHILDTDSAKLEFVENTKKLYRRILYDDVLDTEGHGNFNFLKYKECFLKLVVVSKTNPAKFDMFCDKLFEAGIYDLQIVESLETTDTNTSDDDSYISEKELSKNTMELIDGYIDELKMDGGGNLKSLMRELYTESLSI